MQPDLLVAPSIIQVVDIDSLSLLTFSLGFYDECGALSIDFLQSFEDENNYESFATFISFWRELTLNGDTVSTCFPTFNEFNKLSFQLNFETQSISMVCQDGSLIGRDFEIPANRLFGIAYGSNQCAFIDDICLSEIRLVDLDSDGFTHDVDCDDNNPEINPEAIEIPNNGMDENCDGTDRLRLTSSIVEQMIPYPNPFATTINMGPGGDVAGRYVELYG